MATIETVEQRQEAKSKRPVSRRARVQIRKISPWSALKVSLIFYFCLMLVMLLGFAILFTLLDSIGVIEPVEQLLGEVGFGTPQGTGPEAVAVYEINFGYVMRTLAIVGVISTFVWALFTVFLTFLYNLISDLVGGIEVTLLERQ